MLLRRLSAPAALVVLASLVVAPTAQADASGTGTRLPELPAAVAADLDRSERAVLAGATPVGGERRQKVSVVRQDAGRLTIDEVDVAAVDAPQVQRLLAAQPSVDSASLARPVKAFADPYASQQWALTRLKAPQVRTAQGTGAAPVVAVLDTGVDASHPDLDGVLVPGYDAVLDVAGVTKDVAGHGTHVSGIVAAEVGNAVGVEGLLSRVRIMPVKVLEDDGSGDTTDAAQGITWAVDNGADVINMSLGGEFSDPAVQAAVAYAETKGVVVVAAMGNEGERCSPTSYPAAYPTVLAVGAVDQASRRPAFSSTGAHIDVAAPGVDVLSTYPVALAGPGDAPYAYMDGTSMASPYVAAVAAAVHAKFPELTPAQVRRQVAGTADDLGPPGFDQEFGSGLVDPLAALTTAPATVVAPDQSGSRAVPCVVPRPTGLQLAAGNASVNASWSAPTSSPLGPVTSYRVTATPASGTARTVIVTGTRATLVGLVNGTRYVVGVQAVTASGRSDAATASATPRTVTSAPGLTSVVPGNRRATVSWTAPTALHGAPVTSYRLVVTRTGHPTTYVAFGSTTRRAYVTGLSNGGAYWVRVQARNAAGYSSSARALAVRPRTVSTAPRSPIVASGSTRDRYVSVTAGWRTPYSYGGATITAYLVRVRQVGTSREDLRYASGTARSLRVSGLRRNVRYAVTVQARNAAGYSIRSVQARSAAAR